MKIKISKNIFKQDYKFNANETFITLGAEDNCTIKAIRAAKENLIKYFMLFDTTEITATLFESTIGNTNRVEYCFDGSSSNVFNILIKKYSFLDSIQVYNLKYNGITIYLNTIAGFNCLDESNLKTYDFNCLIDLLGKMFKMLDIEFTVEVVSKDLVALRQKEKI